MTSACSGTRPMSLTSLTHLAISSIIDKQLGKTSETVVTRKLAFIPIIRHSALMLCQSAQTRAPRLPLRPSQRMPRSPARSLRMRTRRPPRPVMVPLRPTQLSLPTTPSPLSPSRPRHRSTAL